MMEDEQFVSEQAHPAFEPSAIGEEHDECVVAASEQAESSSGESCDDGAEALSANHPFVYEVPPRTCSFDELASLLPFPREDANKYTRGTLTLVAGSDRYPGAACLAAYAAQRMGAGYVRAMVPASVRPLVLAAHPSVVALARKGWDAADLDVVKAGHPQAVCVGPGFDARDEESSKLVKTVLRRATSPVLIDGGALSCVATKSVRKLLKRRFVRGLPTVMTPHGGEAAVLARTFGFPTDDPARLALLLSLAYGAIIVLKGPNTFVSDGECTYVVTEGTAALAKAGTGDVLAGMIGSLLAQGLDSLQASLLGATLHGCAGRLASARYTPIGVRAEDVCDFIPEAIEHIAHQQCSE